ncbi:MAG TPA: hypothetical protein VGB08_00010 [Allosphingosinicella sp.]|jgi:hypothetical protein
MPRYFFHIHDGVGNHDTEGTELKDLATAKCEGVKLAGRAICDDAATFWDRREWSLTVTDETGLVLYSLNFLGVEAPAAARLLPPQIVQIIT